MRAEWRRTVKRSAPLAEERSMLPTVIIVVLVVMLLGAVPSWSYNRDWGYYPGGFLGMVLLVMIVLVLTGRL
jgi:Protein of unknown function (DUF3309)